ncbi:MAG: prepilin peptidase, partial [Phycisphaeraceae bacterium]|nr:prepilin peptidase [Phycisphaeraceae bacterium]
MDELIYTHWFWLLYLGAFGACVGSFINVVIYRMPRGLGLARPASRCPSCGRRIRWFQNIPILSWVALRGRCHYCRTRISAGYLGVELLTGGLYAGLYYACFMTGLHEETFGAGTILVAWPYFVPQLVLVAALLAATLIDARYFIIPLAIPVFATVASW